MNRVERRKRERMGLSVPREPMINVKASDVKAMKEKSTQQAIDTAFLLMLAIPVMVLHDKYGKLMRREVDGVKREERFADMCLELYDSFEKGYVTLDDLADCLWEEAGLKIERSKRK